MQRGYITITAVRDMLYTEACHFAVTKGLDESECDNTYVNFEQPPRGLLKPLAWYANALTKITHKSARITDSSNFKSIRLSSGSCWSLVYGTEASYDISDSNTVKKSSKISIGRYKEKRQQSLPPSNDNISYCYVWLEKAHSKMQCPYLSKPPDLLQKKGDNFKTFDGTVRSAQSCFHQGCGIFRRWFEFVQRA